ncbi:hypothetical protein cym2001_04700 [Pseudomonas sp. CYM-20-01]|nr:hypothetical protein cym2001_04700 [Pseudomonas sp. CYM-20-01]
MYLHRYFTKNLGRLDKNDTKLTYASTDIQLPYIVSKICLHETAIKLTVYIAAQNTETAPVFKGKPAERSIQMTHTATADVSLCVQSRSRYTTKQNPRRMTQCRYLQGAQ